MVVSKIPYERYTIEQGREAYEKVVELVKKAECAKDLLAAKKVFDDAYILFATACSLANCRFTLDTQIGRAHV